VLDLGADAGVREALGKQVDRYQAVVARLATTSQQLRTVCVTVDTAVAALAASSHRGSLFGVAIAATVALAVLDSYYLALERCARAAQNDLVRQALSGTPWTGVSCSSSRFPDPDRPISATRHALRRSGCSTVRSHSCSLLGGCSADRGLFLRATSVLQHGPTRRRAPNATVPACGTTST
jgi:hypothetical protein